MANIGITVKDARIGTSWYASNPDWMGIDIAADLKSGDTTIPYERSHISLHGTPDDMRRLAHAVLAALPTVEAPAAVEETVAV